MQRIWRSKPTPGLIKLMEESVDIRLYLVAEKGPLSFHFQDENSKKISINISDKINCSCSSSKKENDHCVHSMFVLNRIFKLSFKDQLILQNQFTDAELNKMIESRKKNKKNIIETEGDNAKRNKIKKKKNNNLSDFSYDEDNDNTENRMNLIDDKDCAICQEEMYNAEGLYFCEESCGHNFHLNCLKIWSHHKKANEDKGLNCPMCRQKWNEDMLKIKIVKNMAVKVNLKIHKGINCNNCERKNIKGERFHCLICEDYNLCIECFNLGIHRKFHNDISKNKNDKNKNVKNFFSENLLENTLILKRQPEDNWVGFDRLFQKDENNNKYNIKQIKFSQYLISLMM